VVLVLLNLQKALIQQLRSQNFQGRNFKVNVSVLAKLILAMIVLVKAASVALVADLVAASADPVVDLAAIVATVVHEETPGKLLKKSELIS
jgi:uncharacterized membrane protein